MATQTAETPEARSLDLPDALGLAGALPDQNLDEIVRDAAAFCRARAAELTLFENANEWVVAAHMLGEPHREAIGRARALASTALGDHGLLAVIEDARAHPVFASHHAVTGTPRIGSFAAAMLISRRGERIGVLGVSHGEARQFDYDQRMYLAALAKQATFYLELQRAERRTRLVQQRLEESQRMAGVSSFECDLRTGRSWTSGESFRRLQLAPDDDMMSTVHREHVHPDDLERLDAARARHLKDGTTHSIEYRLVRTDGKVLHVRSVLEPILNEKGVAVAIRGVTLERSRENQLMEQLEASHCRLQRIQQEQEWPLH